SDSLYILARGEVAIFRDGEHPKQGRKLLAKLTAPAFFGEMGLLTGQARTATIVAESEALCYRLDKRGFEAIIQARPELAEAMSGTWVVLAAIPERARGTGCRGVPSERCPPRAGGATAGRSGIRPSRACHPQRRGVHPCLGEARRERDDRRAGVPRSIRDERVGAPQSASRARRVF